MKWGTGQNNPCEMKDKKYKKGGGVRDIEDIMRRSLPI